MPLGMLLGMLVRMPLCMPLGDWYMWLRVWFKSIVFLSKINCCAWCMLMPITHWAHLVIVIYVYYLLTLHFLSCLVQRMNVQYRPYSILRYPEKFHVKVYFASLLHHTKTKTSQEIKNLWLLLRSNKKWKNIFLHLLVHRTLFWVLNLLVLTWCILCVTNEIYTDWNWNCTYIPKSLKSILWIIPVT